MYSPKLSILLAALPESRAEQLQGLAPDGTRLVSLPSFGSLQWPACDIIIMGDNAGLTPAEVHQLSPSAALYLVTSQPETLDPDTLSLLREVWPARMTDGLWDYRLRRMLADFIARKESYYYRSALDTIINTLPDLVWFKDVKGDHLKVNNAFCDFVGKPREDVEGHDHYYIWDITEEAYRNGDFICLETDAEVLRQGGTCRFEERVDKADGPRTLSVYKSPLRDEDGSAIGTVAVAHDATDEINLKRRIDAMAFSDPLTGLYNRYAFYLMLAHERKTLRVTVILFDLDNLRLVNECFGHQAGDEAILRFSQLLREAFPDNLCVRMNGDIFAVAVLGEVERTKITDPLDSLFSRLKKSFSPKKTLNILAVSAGIADTPNPSQPVDDVICRCSYAVAHLKRRNGFTIALDPTKPPSPILLELLRAKADSAYCFYDDLPR